jgi:2-phospho-L-lactate guanylyltransferase
VRVFAIVPVRGLGASKSRLEPVLRPGEREELISRMLERVLAAVRESGAVERACVVSPEAAALRFARLRGVEALEQRSGGLNPALEEARRWSLVGGAGALLVLPADLPLVSGSDIQQMVRLAERASLILAPDDGGTGTNALLVRPPEALPFRFGPGSFRAHREEAGRLGLEFRACRTPGLAFDLDTPGDLARLRGLERAIS